LGIKIYIMDIYIDLGYGSKSTMEFSERTQKLMREIVQWVRDHPQQIDDDNLGSEEPATIIMRLLADPGLLLEYEEPATIIMRLLADPGLVLEYEESDDSTCMYVYKSGPMKGIACGKPVADDMVSNRCAFHDHPIFRDEFRTLFRTSLTQVLQDTKEKQPV
jgi:hypothetical protein